MDIFDIIVLNTFDIIVLIILAVAIVQAVIDTVLNIKKSGGCSGNCASCGFAGNCKDKK